MTSLEYFLDLTSVKADKRIQAAEDLLAGLPETRNSDVDYALKRLVRGLSSSKDGARQGFATCLTELLAKYEFDVQEILDLIHASSQKEASHDEKQLYFSRIFGYQALVLSGILERATPDQMHELSNNLIKIFNTKNYLRQASCSVLIDLCAVPNGDAQYTAEHFLTAFVYPEHIWFALKLQGQELDWTKMLKDWKHGKILHHKNMNKLSEILVTADYLDMNVHPVFNTIVESIVKAENDKNMTLEQFWTLVDRHFFTATHERKYLGFQMFLAILPLINPDQIPLVFTRNFLKTLINSLQHKDSYLFKQAQVINQKLLELARERSNVALSLLVQLMGKNGHYNFDAVTKTKTVETIMSSLSPEDIASFVDYVISSFTESDLEDPDTVRKWCLDQLNLLLKTQSLKKQQEWIEKICRLVIAHSFFTVVSQDPKDPVIKVLDPKPSEETTHYLRERFFSMLGLLQNLVLPDQEVSGLKNGDSWFYYCLEQMQAFKQSKHLETDFEADEVIAPALKKIQTIRNLIKSTEDKKALAELRSFEALLVYVTLMAHHEADEAADVIQELVECYDRLFPVQDKQTKKKRKQEETEEQPLPLEVLVDILVSFMAKSSSTLRHLASSAFKTFSPRLTEKSLDLLFEVLTAKDGVQGSAELFEEEDDDEMDEDEEEEEEEEEPVDEELKQKIQEALGNDEEEELSDLDDDQMAQFDEKLAEIFKQKRDIKAEQRDAKQTVMNFKLRVIDFIEIFIKTCPTSPLILKTIDPLLTLYQESSKQDGQKALSQKLMTLLMSKLCKPKDLPEISDVEEAFVLLEKLHDRMRKLSNTSTHPTLVALSVYLVKVISVAQQQTPAKKQKKEKQMSHQDRILDIYKQSFEHFMSGKSSIRPTLFFEFAERLPNMSFRLLSLLIPLTTQDKEPKAYPLVSAFEVFVQMLKRTPKEEKGIQATVTQLSISMQQALEKLPQSPLSGPYSMNKERAKTMFKVILNAIQMTRKLFEKELNMAWQADKLVPLLETVTTSDRFNGLGSLVSLKKQIQALLKE
ncbi:DNA polymerase phi-domain-containing protein [Gorgonomyces haynaldii]|nr:DNA polymerase phi-domain-containing protein [Gorgonomyces haynaldii]